MQQINTSEKLREVRGYAIISKGDVPQQTGKNTFTIPSQQGNGSYTVTIESAQDRPAPALTLRAGRSPVSIFTQ